MARVSFTSNIVGLVRSLRDGLSAFGFTSHSAGAAPTVGDAVHGVFTDGICDRNDVGVDQDLSEWAENSDNPEGHGYASWKERTVGHRNPNILTGQMISRESVSGELRNGHHEMDHEYGTGVRGVSAAGNVGPSDREKAEWAHRPNRFTGVVRSFFGITEADADRAAEEVADALIAELRDKFR
jgi:hypothetical protein